MNLPEAGKYRRERFVRYILTCRWAERCAPVSSSNPERNAQNIRLTDSAKDGNFQIRFSATSSGMKIPVEVIRRITREKIWARWRAHQSI